MNCLIDQIASKAHQKNKRLEVVVRYIKMKYRISIDASSLSRRLQSFAGQKLDKVALPTSSSPAVAPVRSVQ